MLLQKFSEALAGELAPLVGVEDLRLSLAQCFFQGFDAEISVQGVGQPPGHHVAAVPIHAGHQVQEAPGHGDVGDISRPHLVGPGDLHATQQIRVDLVPRRRLAGPGPPVDDLQSQGPHQTLDPLPVYPVTLSAQPDFHAPRPVEGRGQILLVYLLHEGQVLLGRGPGPVVDTRSADAQQGALPDGG